MPVLALGVSHHQASADDLTRFTASATRAADELRAAPGVRGLITLATCNRCELYIEADRFHETVHVAHRLLAAAGAEDLLGALQARAARSAVEHLFLVACGLDSMVVGETEVVGQVRSALSDNGSMASPALHRLFQMALATSKVVASTTTIGSLGRSVTSVALDLVESRHGRLAGQRALLIGTGAYAGVVTADLVRRGAAITVHSASGRAETFAQTHPVTPLAPDDLTRAIARAKVVVACSGTGQQQLTAAQVTSARAGVFGMLPVVDLALGRDVEPQLAATPGVDLIDLDVVGRHVPAEHSGSLARARELVDRAVDTYLDRERGRLADSAVTVMRAHVEEIVARELDSVMAQQPPEVAAAVQKLLHRVTNAFLHAPSLRASESARAGDLDDYTRALETVFGLQVDQ